MAKSLAERREETRKAVEKPAVEYRELKKTMENSYNINWKSDLAMKRNFFNLYDKEISEFIDAHHDANGQQMAEYTTHWFDLSGKYEELVKDYLDLFRGQKRFGLNDSVSDEEHEKNKRNDNARKQADEFSLYKTGVVDSLKAGNVKLLGPDEADKMDEKISEGAKNGVREISKWLYRNCSKRGIGIGDDHTKFVNMFVMAQPLRVKLLGFYLVEKKKRKQPDMMDIMASQVGYEPDLDEFKSAMIATKWKFWKRVDGSYIYWDKLSEAMRKAQSYRGALNNYASLGEVEAPSESAQEQVSEGEQQSEQQPESQSEQQPESQSEQQPESQPEQQPESQSEQQPESQPEQQPESQSEQQPESQSEQQPESQSEQQSESQAEQQPEKKSERPKGQGATAVPKYDHAKLVKAAQKRKVAFDVFIAAAAKHREILENKKKSKDKKLVSDSARNVEEHLKILGEIDDEVQKNGGISYTKKTGEFNDKQANKKTDDGSIEMTSEEKLEFVKEKIVGTSTTVLEQSGSTVSSLPDYGSYIHWNIGDASQVKMTRADGILNSVAGLTSFISGCLAIAALTKGASKETAGEIAKKCFEITSDMSAIAESVTNSAYTIKNAKEIAAGLEIAKSPALTHASKAIAYGGIVSGVVNYGVGAAKLLSTDSQREDINAGAKELSDLEKEEANRGMINRFTSLADRIHDNEEIRGTADLVAGALQLAGGIMDATLVGAGIGTILNGIGSVITVSTSIAMYFKNKSDKKKTIDEYIGMDKPLEGTAMTESLLDTVLGNCYKCIDAMKWSPTKKTDYITTIGNNKEKLKDTLRDDVTAMFGFANINSFYVAIIEEYAEFLYAHAFYKDGVVERGKMVLDKDVKDGKCKKEEAYAKLLNGIGVDVKYPEDSDGEPNVTVEDISAKIVG